MHVKSKKKDNTKHIDIVILIQIQSTNYKIFSDNKNDTT